ncbi:hypothetical protein ACWEF6_41150 [Amycolatopsis sp. NPDC004772]
MTRLRTEIDHSAVRAADQQDDQRTGGGESDQRDRAGHRGERQLRTAPLQE